MSTAIGSIGSTSQVSLATLYQEMFKKVDQNGDGKIDKTEFTSAGKAEDASKAEEMFGQIDTDGDGSISEAESEAFLTKLDEEREAKQGGVGLPAGQEWQAGILQAMLTQTSQGTQASQTSMSLYA